MAIAPWRTARAASTVFADRSGCGADALQPLMHRIAVGENVMRRLPIPMLVRQAEPCDAQRRRVRERAAEIGESGPVGDRGFERGDDRFRIVAQEKLGQLGVLRPRAAITTNREQPRKFSGGSLAQRDQVFRLTPLSRLVRAPRRRHAADDEGQQVGRVRPADQVEAFEGLVDEVERVSAIGEDAVGLGGEQQVGQSRRRRASGNRGENRTLGCVAMADRCPAPQPPLFRGMIRSTAEG